MAVLSQYLVCAKYSFVYQLFSDKDDDFFPFCLSEMFQSMAARGTLFLWLCVVIYEKFICCDCCMQCLTDRCMFWWVMLCHSLSSTLDILLSLKPERDGSSLAAGAGCAPSSSSGPTCSFAGTPVQSCARTRLQHSDNHSNACVSPSYGATAHVSLLS